MPSPTRLAPLRRLLSALAAAFRPAVATAVALFGSAVPSSAATLTTCRGALELSAESRGDVTTVRWSGAGCNGRLEVSGELAWQDGPLPTRLAPGAYLRAEETADGTRRQVSVRPGDDGRPEVDWQVDGRQRTFDAAARSWLDERVLLLLRQTGLDADQRVARLLDDGGPEALLTEVEAVDNDRVESLYLSAALRRGGLTPSQEARLLRQGARLVTSDADLTDLLEVAARPAASEPTLLAVAEAARSVRSDGDRCRALRAGLAVAATPATVAALLDAAAGVRSDGDLSSLLVATVGSLDLTDAEVRRAFAGAVGSVASDGDRSRVLTALATRDDLPPPALALLLDAAAGIGSDGDRASLLVFVARRHELAGELRAAYLQAFRGIASEADRQRALDAL